MEVVLLNGFTFLVLEVEVVLEVELAELEAELVALELAVMKAHLEVLEALGLEVQEKEVMEATQY